MKVLVRVPQWLGDAVVSTVFLNRLKTQHPEYEISVLTVPGLAALFETHPAVSHVLKLPYPQGSVFDAARALRDRRFDIAYVLPHSFRAALEAKLANIPKRIGYPGDFRRWLLTKTLPYDSTRLYPHRYLALIGEETLPVSDMKPFFPVQKPSDVKLNELGLADLENYSKPYLAMAPASVAPARTWSADRFAAVADHFVKTRGGTVFLFGSAREKTVVSKIASSVGKSAIDTSGMLNLPELGWLISKCHSFVGNDSGLMHVAASFKIPSVILFGPSEPAFAVPPWGRTVYTQHKEIFCVPCLRNTCVRLGKDRDACMKAIDVTEVTGLLASL